MPAPDSIPVSTAVKVSALSMTAATGFRRPTPEVGSGKPSSGPVGRGARGREGVSQRRWANVNTQARAARATAIVPYVQRQLSPLLRITVTSSGPVVAPRP